MKHPELAVELARALAAFAHAGQTDKAGQPYLTHPVAVAGKVRTPEEKITALLHDVLEDTFVLPETIGNLFGAEILAAVQAVTKREDEDYMDFVRKQPQFNSQFRHWRFIAVCTAVDDDVRSRYDAQKASGKKGLVTKIIDSSFPE